MRDIEVLDDPATAQVALEPVRSRILSLLAEPGSASTVASAMGESRQRINYHLRALADHGLLRLVEEKARRGRNERIMQATAKSYVVSPAALGEVAASPSGIDRRSPRYLISVAVRMIREVGELAHAAEHARQPLAALVVDTEVRVGSHRARIAFTRELEESVAAVAARHHDESSKSGRLYRLVVAAHPSVGTVTDDEARRPRAGAGSDPSVGSRANPGPAFGHP